MHVLLSGLFYKGIRSNRGSYYVTWLRWLCTRRKERKRTNNHFDMLFPCPPALSAFFRASLPLSFSVACAHSSLAHSLSDSLFNGGHEKKAGTGGGVGVLWHHRWEQRHFSLTLVTLGIFFFEVGVMDKWWHWPAFVSCMWLFLGVFLWKHLLPLLTISDWWMPSPRADPVLGRCLYLLYCNSH